MQRNLSATFGLVELHKVQIIQSFSPTERVQKDAHCSWSEKSPSAVSSIRALLSWDQLLHVVICFSFDPLSNQLHSVLFLAFIQSFYYYYLFHGELQSSSADFLSSAALQ